MNKFIWLLIAFIWIAICAVAQKFDAGYTFLHSGSVVQDKNFYLLTLMQQVPSIKRTLAVDEKCKAMRLEKVNTIQAAIDNLKDSVSFLGAFRFSPAEAEEALHTAGSAFNHNRNIQLMVMQHMRPSGYFAIYNALHDSLMFINAMKDALNGLNNIIDTYGMGKKGSNAFIDSVSYDVNSSYYRSVLASNAKILFSDIDSMLLFFEPALNMAMSLLHLNNRNEAGRFEPLITGENSKAYAKVRHTGWAKYRYAAIMVPGFGPEDNHRIDPLSMLRVKLSVKRYHQKMAPFIIVSGGYVHPFQTSFCEAVEMKKELMDEYGIPESAIIIEPHARHTTTNIRNANRLIYRYGMPYQKPVLLTTTAEQSTYIESEAFKKRCMTDMGHIPYQSLKRITAYDIEYWPEVESLFMKSTDPLDP